MKAFNCNAHFSRKHLLFMLFVLCIPKTFSLETHFAPGNRGRTDQKGPHNVLNTATRAEMISLQSLSQLTDNEDQ